MADAEPHQDQGESEAYRVLARKYRPSRFDELIGQESLVQTLSNALEMGRLAHAFVLTGLRGIGKTTTARIIARGLNCTGADGKGGPTLSPCGECSSCVDIAEGHHVDVIEMDAASNTGVDDVREIIDGVGYRPLAARYKIYIIDEVHMLSKSAFNALLKTLEEPPEAVKFIFATTEIRKVPVTVLSRCQRFDLRRVPVDMMVGHLDGICKKEKIAAEESALARIARAAEGSVRDALSMLDQAAALTADKITDADVALILGQAGRQEALAITGDALNGKTADALTGMASAIGRGAEPQMVLRDMLDLLHLAARVAAGGGVGDAPESEAETLKDMAGTHGMARLVRAWQITLKGHGELALAPDQAAAAEMVLIRLAYASTMPPPSELIRKLEASEKDSPASAPSPPPSPSSPAPAPAPAAAPADSTPADDSPALPEPASDANDGEAAAAPDAAPAESDAPPEEAPTQAGADDAARDATPAPHAEVPENLAQLAMLFENNGERLLAAKIREQVRPVVLEPGRFEFSHKGRVEADFTKNIARHLTEWTGLRWMVSFSEVDGGRTLAEMDEEDMAVQIASVKDHPMVAATLEAFPGATIAEVKPVESAVEPVAEKDDDTDDAVVEVDPESAAIPDVDQPKQAMEG